MEGAGLEVTRCCRMGVKPVKVEQEALFLQLWDKLGFYSQTCFSTRRNVCALQLKGAVLFTFSPVPLPLIRYHIPNFTFTGLLLSAHPNQDAPTSRDTLLIKVT